MSKHPAHLTYLRRPAILLATLLSVCMGMAQPHAANATTATQAPNTTTPIQHFIVLMEEDRSFDSFFAQYPGSTAQSNNTCVQLEANSTECQRPYALGTDPVKPLSEVQQKHVGAFTLGYYGASEVPYLWNLADRYVLFDHYFSSIKTTKGTISPNKFYAIAATASNSTKLTTGGYDRTTTIFDRLQERGVSWKVYVQDYDATVNFRSVKVGDKVPRQVAKVPLLSFGRFSDNPQLAANIVDLQQYYVDLQQDKLPAVSFVYAYGAGEPKSSSLLISQRHLKSLVQALMRSPAWPSSALLWTHDQSGGWYDHLAPPQMDGVALGARVPAMLISPYARSGHVDGTVLEHSSIVQFIQTNWALEPLGQRDRQANSFLSAFDFGQAPRLAEYLPFARVETVKVATPSRLWIYVLYGTTLALAVVVGVVVLTRHPRTESRAPQWEAITETHI